MKSSISSRLEDVEHKLDEMSRNMATLYKQQATETREQRKPVEDRPAQRASFPTARPAIAADAVKKNASL